MGARMFGAALRLYFDYLPRESSSFILRFSCGKVSDHLVEMPLKNALCMHMIKNMIDSMDNYAVEAKKMKIDADYTESEIIEIPCGQVISKSIMKLCIAYANHYNGKPPSVEKTKLNPHLFEEYDKKMLESIGSFIEVCYLCELALYLEFETLHVVVCKYIGNICRTKTKQQVLEMMGRTTDFTAEEYEKAMKHALNVKHSTQCDEKEKETDEKKEDNDDDDDDDDDDVEQDKGDMPHDGVGDYSLEDGDDAIGE